MEPGKGDVSLDDERVRVTTWTFGEPGSNTGWHRHEFDYLVVPVTGGAFTVVGPDGAERTLEQVAGSPYLGKQGTEHDVVFSGEGKAVFVEIELKR